MTNPNHPGSAPGGNINQTPQITYLVAPTWNSTFALNAQNTKSVVGSRYTSNQYLPESVVGEVAEKIVLNIAKLLEADDVFICNPESQLNHELKTDLVIRKGNMCWPYQIKNSEKGGQEFLAKNSHGVVLDGQRYDRPGLIVAPKTYKERRQLLKILATAHGLAAVAHLTRSKELRKKFLDNPVPIREIGIKEAARIFPANGLAALETLGLAQRHKDKWFFTQRA